ncbi:YbaK/prolyl-tRNA synthetase associated domain-containing protein [Trinickia sp. Y13]|jgi:Ala-tRNA(Pro) deacylase|uniref:YbaK/prolyl-tRNA synthetase associated domain-containing protein n=1 Tax=Trinickia sp. Y13 TaxID=2917807 RepID=UPI0024067AE0|nr:YbaK/prolyl-tRNA synthetase associated domain-containing protein [Trinickia sp. Y13]MDG0024585.1 YbaK/prolyl-tRNA synthetase associated domain-containing protein [Trinickia sp. Y13]
MTPTVFDKLVALFEDEAARFRVIEHPAEGRSDLVATIRGTAPGQGAKAMLCRSKDDDRALILAILPGDRRLDFKRMAEAAGIKKATLASPEEAQRVTGCVIGAIPPFSFSANIKLIVDPDLVESFGEIAFNAGRLDRSIILDSVDYLRIAKPLLQSLCA